MEEEGLRLDQFLTGRLHEQFSRSSIQRWIKAGGVRILAEGKEIPSHRIKPSLAIEPGQKIIVEIPPETRALRALEPVPIDFPVLFEDEHLAVIIKPPGLAVHPGPGEGSAVTLLNGLLHRWPAIAQIESSAGDRKKVGKKATKESSKNSAKKAVEPLPRENAEIRPGIVHRLDRPTEGVMVIARNARMQWKLSRLFQRREVEKEYLAWLSGAPPESSGRIEQPLRRHPQDRMRMQVHPSGRMAVTEYTVLDTKVSRKGRKFTLVRVNLLTGRTHQIRAHFAHLKCPVVGDDLYSSSSREFSKFGLLLLSRRLSFRHPVTGQGLDFEAPLPERFLEFERKCTFF